jgi:serine protease Do
VNGGVVIQSVRPGSPAEDAGLAPGDVILEVDRRPVTSADQFVGAVHANSEGKDMLLLVWSKGSTSYRTIRPEVAKENS